MQRVSKAADLPGVKQLRDWARVALSSRDEAELTLRIVDEAESAELNSHYRHRAGATNVLSFPADVPESLGIPLLGDIVVCAPVVQREAVTQNKTCEAHWAHMIVHGCLHLIGYDHQTDPHARKMEALEIELLAQLGYPNPYQ